MSGEKLYAPAVMLDHLNFRKGNGCWPRNAPYSRDPVVWARAYLRSFDWIRPFRTYQWFANAMATGSDERVYDSADHSE